MKKNSIGEIGCVILAAGEGTRMKSDYPKVLFDICGKAIIEYILESVGAIDKIKKIYVVVGYKDTLVKDKILNSEFLKEKTKEKIVFVKQQKRLGSGDAVLRTKQYLDKRIRQLLVVSGDIPLVSKKTLEDLLEKHFETGVDLSVLSMTLDEPYGYGRILRDISKNFVGIIEETEANETQRQIKEVNSGIYVFNVEALWPALKKIKPENKKNEYFLTDVVKYVSSKQAILCKNSQELRGVNTRKDLSEIEEIVRRKILEKFMLEGITIIMPETVYIDHKSVIKKDTRILAGSIILNSFIEENCVVGPYSVLKDVKVKKNTEIVYSYVLGAEIGENCKIGPFSRIRPNTILKDEVKIGNFVEVKNSIVDSFTKINHLSYIGDAEIEQEVNIGAGTITCNYDGVKKHKSYIGRRTFVGSNVNLIAPIKVGNNVVIAAGSTVTKDVPSNTFVIARAKEVQKIGHRIVKKIFGKSLEDRNEH